VVDRILVPMRRLGSRTDSTGPTRQLDVAPLAELQPELTMPLKGWISGARVVTAIGLRG
jgi:hypothetical protein